MVLEIARLVRDKINKQKKLHTMWSSLTRKRKKESNVKTM